MSTGPSLIEGAFGDLSVALPDGFEPPVHWPRWDFDDKEFIVQWRKWQADPANYTPPENPDHRAPFK